MILIDPFRDPFAFAIDFPPIHEPIKSITQGATQDLKEQTTLNHLGKSVYDATGLGRAKSGTMIPRKTPRRKKKTPYKRQIRKRTKKGTTIS